MTVVYVLDQYGEKKEFTDREQLIEYLLTPDYSDGGQLETIRDEVDHLRSRLARWIDAQNPTTESLEGLTYGEISMVETDDR